METNMNRTEKSRIPQILLAAGVGCLVLSILSACLLGGLIFLVARPDYGSVSFQSGNPAENDQQVFQSGDPAENGQRVFQSRCSYCHSTGTELIVGPGLAGIFSPGGPELPSGVDYDGRLPNGKEINEANVAEWIREGGSGEIGHMPGQSLSDEQMDALIAYLKTLQK